MMKIYDKKLAYPYFVWMVLFTVVPLIIVVYYAFTDANGAFTWITSPPSAATVRCLPAACCWPPHCHGHLSGHCVPGGLFSFPPAGEQAAHHAHAGDAAHVDELPAAHLRMDGPAQHQRPGERRSGRVRPWPLQYAQHLRRGGAGHGVQLCALYDPAAVHQHDQDRPEPGGSCAGSGRFHHQDPFSGCSSP